MKKYNITLLVMDVDGTLTDGHIFVTEEGEVCKVFDVKDGYGISVMLPQYGIIPVIITGRKSNALQKRCEELKIYELHQGCSDKLTLLKQIASYYNLQQNDRGKFNNIAYIGDDLNDFSCISSCEVTACPNDAVDKIKKNVQFICSKKGGNGAVREFIEWLINNFYETE